MYISIGSDMAVRDKSIIGIFDLDNTSWSKVTRQFLYHEEKEGAVLDVSGALPKSFILTEEFGMEHIYLTQFNASALEKRLEKEKIL